MPIYPSIIEKCFIWRCDGYFSFGFENGALNTEKFLELIKGKDAEWLEIAATILSVYDRYRRKFSGAELTEWVISTSCDIKRCDESESQRAHTAVKALGFLLPLDFIFEKRSCAYSFSSGFPHR